MKDIPMRNIRDAINEPALSGSFRIRKVEDILAGNNMVQKLHRHSFYYVLILDRGAGEHRIDFISYAVANNCVFFMRPGQVHELELNQGSTGYLLTFSHDFYSPADKAAGQVLRRISHKNFCTVSADRFSNLRNVLSGILHESTQKQDRYLSVIQSSLNILFVELLRCCADGETVRAGKDAYMQERLYELQLLINTHFVEHNQVDFYAKQLNLSNYQLNTITKTTLGKTCSEVIDDHILLEAKRYLLATNNQVNQVAWHLGYEDASYFIRFFKKHTGHSPEAFRENFK